MDSIERALYLVEHSLPPVTGPELDLLQGALTTACARSSARGERVDYLGSAFLPRPARLLSLFRATDAEAVRKAAESAQAPAAILEVAITLPAPGQAKEKR